MSLMTNELSCMTKILGLLILQVRLVLLLLVLVLILHAQHLYVFQALVQLRQLQAFARNLWI